jgi:hypothetical protein
MMRERMARRMRRPAGMFGEDQRANLFVTHLA